MAAKRSAHYGDVDGVTGYDAKIDVDMESTNTVLEIDGELTKRAIAFMKTRRNTQEPHVTQVRPTSSPHRHPLFGQ